MARPELEHLELLAEVDALLGRLQRWADRAPPWQPAEPCRALVGRLAERAESLRVRLEAPLVVATLGGTGTGKSALVNALVGAEVVHGYLGVRFRGETDGDGRPGVEVLGVLPGAPADRAGLKRGDRILEANGKPVDQPVRLENVLSVLPSGSEVTIKIERDGRRLEVKATLTRKPGS